MKNIKVISFWVKGIKYSEGLLYIEGGAFCGFNKNLKELKFELTPTSTDSEHLFVRSYEWINNDDDNSFEKSTTPEFLEEIATATKKAVAIKIQLIEGKPLKEVVQNILKNERTAIFNEKSGSEYLNNFIITNINVNISTIGGIKPFIINGFKLERCIKDGFNVVINTSKRTMRCYTTDSYCNIVLEEVEMSLNEVQKVNEYCKDSISYIYKKINSFTLNEILK